VSNTLGDKPKLNVRKEQYILAEVQRQLPELEDFFVTWDCPISGGCSNKRPDMCYDFGAGSLIIEVDENGHRSYDTSCDNKRTIELFQDLGERPVFFIRINPDKYENRDNMFRYTKKLLQLKCNQEEFDYRMADLVNEIPQVYNTFVVKNEVPEKLVNIVKLFM
jgi:hypothetical protein